MFHFLYLDESGTPTMSARGIRDQQWLTLAGFYIAAEDWNAMDTALGDLKDTWLSDYVADPQEIELHSTAFGSESPWRELYADGKWQPFLSAVSEMVRGLPITTLSATINKQAHAAQYVAPIDPYELSYQFVIERFDSALRPTSRGAVILDPRSVGRGAEDERMKVVHRELRRYRTNIVEDVFFPSSRLSSGIQVADVCAWAVKKHHMAAAGRGTDTPIYAGVHERYRRGGGGRVAGYGEKLFP
jgi:hypothetical protein